MPCGLGAGDAKSHLDVRALHVISFPCARRGTCPSARLRRDEPCAARSTFRALDIPRARRALHGVTMALPYRVGNAKRLLGMPLGEHEHAAANPPRFLPRDEP